MLLFGADEVLGSIQHKVAHAFNCHVNGFTTHAKLFTELIYINLVQAYSVKLSVALMMMMM